MLNLFVVKNNNVDSIKPSSSFAGQMESWSWKIGKNRVNIGDTVGFTNSWSEDTHTQGIVTGKFKDGDRTVIIFEPTVESICVSDMNIYNKYSEKNYIM